MVITPFPDDTVWILLMPHYLCLGLMQLTDGKLILLVSAYGTSYGVVIHQTTDGGNTWQKKVISTTQGDFAVQIQFVDI